MDKEVRERFDQVMQALHEVDLKAASFLGWAKDYQDHNTKDKVAIKANVDRVEGRFDEFKREEHVPLRDNFYSFRIAIFVAVAGTLLSIVGYLAIFGPPWISSAMAVVP